MIRHGLSVWALVLSIGGELDELFVYRRRTYFAD